MKMALEYNKNVAAVLLITAFMIQVIIISYNQITGYITIESIMEAMFRLLFATVLSFLISSVAFAMNNGIISIFDRWTQWEERFTKRLFLEMGAASLMGAVLMGSITYILDLFGVYEGDIRRHIINNMMIFGVINIIYVSIMEGILFYRRWREERVRTEQLEKENAISRYEALKNQVNPHFLFNNLNVLASLVSKDKATAEKFIQEFSRIYRYILDTSDKLVVGLSEEMDFINSYLFLLKIRYDEGIEYEININQESMEKYIIPLGLQILIENCVKHNVFSQSTPIKIEVYDKDDMIVVENNIRKKEVHNKKEALGLKNLTKRYSFISGEKPVFSIHNDKFVAKIPLIEAE